MRRYFLPLAVCAAIGVVIVILVKLGEQGPPETRPEAEGEPVTQAPPGRVDPFPLGPRTTPTALSEHHWLSELERALQRKDLSRAYTFRGRVCEDLDRILQSERLTRNLLNAIREHGVESDDPRRRDVVLPILRVLQHPEATQMIEEEYYKARNEQERMMLLEAMSHNYHDPARAAVWAVERALNAETEDDRVRAFEVVERFSYNSQLIFVTARQIYESTTRSVQKAQMMEAISMAAGGLDDARKWLRRKLRNPRADEIGNVIAGIEGWGDEDDAALLETLALEFPGLGDIMRDRARAIRKAAGERVAAEGGEPPPPEEPVPPPEEEEEER
ncbi:MAG: hypothetical protein ACYTEZ_02240 [Planctomycetota bacterium]|jgi:hypothetical protein